MLARALQMLVPGGNPSGMKLIELPQWSGKCFVVPRHNLKELKERDENDQPALYFLFGNGEDSIVQSVYIGESENAYARVSSHDSGKDFWDVAVVFTGGLNRAFVKYLEYKATTLAHEAGRMAIENKVQPQENRLSEFEKVSVEHYFENVQFILSALNYEVFESVSSSVSAAGGTMYYLKSDGADARAQLLDDGSLNVLKGSLARVRETNSFGGWSQVARRQFIDDGTFIPCKNNISFEFTKDVLFKSPSAAAATTAGMSINGWTAWKDEKGATLDENLRK